MVTKGKIIEISESGYATIRVPINFNTIIHREVKECYVDFIDSRPLSDKQRKMVYSLINAISEWSGSSTHEIKEALKLQFWAERVDTLADKIFSLSNAPMSLVAEFQKFLISFILDNNIPTKRPLREYVDDIEHYVYMCLINKKCAVCGKANAELNHIDTVGMGNDRTQINHIGKEAISLCRDHHKEYHNIGEKSFFEKYHFTGGIEIDKTICRIYGLKGK